MFVKQPVRQFRHRDVTFGIDPADQNIRMRRQRTHARGRPWRSGVIDPVRALRCANRTAVAALTPKRRAAARHECPRSISPTILTRKSNELLLPMILLQKD